MKKIVLDDVFDFDAFVQEIVAVLSAGGIVMMPSDTCYGFLGDSYNLGVLRRLHELKGMPDIKAVSVCVADKDMLFEYGEFDEVGREIADDFLPGALTIVVPARKYFDGFVGLRLPDHNLMCSVARALGRPFFTTSANLHGKPSPYSFIEVEDQFQGQSSKIDLMIDAGNLDYNDPSTVVRVDDNQIEILREGEFSEVLRNTYGEKVADEG